MSHPQSPVGPGVAEARPAGAAAADRLASLERRLLDHGATALDDGECLELLCGLDPDRALGLLAAFGSLPEVMGSPGTELSRVAGEAAAARVRVAQALAERLLRQPLKRRDVLSSSTSVSAYLRAALTGAPREQFRVLFLDRRNRLIADEVMGWGTVDHAPVYPREVVRRALELNAAAVVLAHNHPAGDPSPSAADVAMTAQVVAAAKALGVAVHDHVIVGGGEVASLKTLGLM